MRSRFLFLILIGGCQGGGVPVPSRLDVTSSLRSSCPDIPDEVLDALLIEVEANRLDGLTFQQSLDVEVSACTAECDNLDCELICASCMSRAVAQIYEVN